MQIRWHRRSGTRDSLQALAGDEAGGFPSPGVCSLLRDTRKQSGFSLRELADAMGVEPDELTKLERGEFRSELTTAEIELMVARYATCLGLDPDAFLSRREPWDLPAQDRSPTQGGGRQAS